MLKKLMETNDRWAPLMARIALGVVMFPHGAQKTLGWFGGQGFSGTVSYMTGPGGIPLLFVLLDIAAEFLGSLGLLLGLLSRVAAFGIACVMVVAVWLVHFQFGFFMNWFGNQRGEGFEYHILALALAAIVMLEGGGRWSVDGAISFRAGQA